MCLSVSECSGVARQRSRGQAVTMKVILCLAMVLLCAFSGRCQVMVSKDWIRVVDGKVYDLSKGHELWHTNGIRIEAVVSNGIVVTMWLDGVGTNKPSLAFVRNFRPAPPDPPPAPGQTGKIVC